MFFIKIKKVQSLKHSISFCIIIAMPYYIMLTLNHTSIEMRVKEWKCHDHNSVVDLFSLCTIILCAELRPWDGFLNQLQPAHRSPTAQCPTSAVGVGQVASWSEPGSSTLKVLKYKYKYFPLPKYLSTNPLNSGQMYLSTFQVLSKCT